MKIDVDFNNIIGKIKPMHAINNVPTVPFDFHDLYGKYTQARIPYARLHDTGGCFGGARYVDIENIFPDFDADENDPASYDFAFTDALLSEMVKHDIKPYYRLGATIENYQYLKPYHIYPPKDNAKWARICEHIIMHYNEGWANGFHFGIEYWEIWNEPDNEPEIADNPMWKGTVTEYFALYHTAATYLKRRFPDIKIGGYASCGFYAISEADVSGVAHSSPRTEYFIEFMEDFFKLAKENGSPMDFFSWHSYAPLKDSLRYAEYARARLTEFGYGDVEVHFNEWNPGIKDRGEPVDAANIAAEMIGMQHTSTDMCMYYDGNMSSSYCGIFDPVHHTVFKAYDAFYYFGKLYGMGSEVEVKCAECVDGVYVCAAISGGEKAVMVANVSGAAVELDMPLGEGFNILATDEAHFNEKLAFDGGHVLLPRNAVWLFTNEG